MSPCLTDLLWYDMVPSNPRLTFNVDRHRQRWSRFVLPKCEDFAATAGLLFSCWWFFYIHWHPHAIRYIVRVCQSTTTKLTEVTARKSVFGGYIFATCCTKQRSVLLNLSSGLRCGSHRTRAGLPSIVDLLDVVTIHELARKNTVSTWSGLDALNLALPKKRARASPASHQPSETTVLLQSRWERLGTTSPCFTRPRPMGAEPQILPSGTW